MATILPVHRTAVVDLYTALFNRAPDASGLAFWAQAYADGASLTGITQSFMGTTEGRATYPAAQTSGQFVAAFYQTVFGRTADAGGLAFWTTALDAAGAAGSDAARAALAGQIVGVVNQTLVGRPDGLSDAAYAQTVADRALFANKAVVGDYVASLNINDVVLARKVLALVTQDPGSIPIAKAFAANGGITPAPPEPSAPPAIVFLVTNADSAADIITKFASYAGTTAAVDASGMNAAKLSAVAGGIAKIDSGGIHGTLTLDVPGYAGATLTTLAPKLAGDASLTVTGSPAADDFTLRQFDRGTTFYAGNGDDIFRAVVDAVAPVNTTLSARHGLVGQAGNDTLQLSTIGTVANALNGAFLSSIEVLSVQTSGGIASLVAPAGLVSVTASGTGGLSVSNLNAATLILDSTTGTGIYAAHYTGGTSAILNMANGANADTVTIDGASLTTLGIVQSGTSNTIGGSLVLGASVTDVSYSGSGNFVIAGMSGGASGSLSITATHTGVGLFALLNVTASVSSFDGSASTSRLQLKFDQSVGTVKGGPDADGITVAGGSTLTGGAGDDNFGLQEGTTQTGTISLASLNAKLVTITDFSPGDKLGVWANVNLSVDPSPPPVTGQLQEVAVTGANLFEATVDAAVKLRLLGADVPYAGFVYNGETYLLVDSNLDGLGAGDTLIRLLGSPILSAITYSDIELTMH